MIIDPYLWEKVRITSIQRVAARSVAVRFVAPKNYRFKAGQYAIVRLLTDERRLLRQYSFSSPPGIDQCEFVIQQEPHGELSTWFYETAQVGDTFDISQAFGAFTWTPDAPHPLLLIAGGSGIAPCLGIIRTHLAAATTPLTLLYSVRNIADACCRDELEALAPPRSAQIVSTDVSPRLSADYIRQHITPDTQVYICGPRGFIYAINEALEQLGVSPARIRHEAFTLA